MSLVVRIQSVARRRTATIRSYQLDFFCFTSREASKSGSICTRAFFSSLDYTLLYTPGKFHCLVLQIGYSTHSTPFCGLLTLLSLYINHRTVSSLYYKYKN